MGEGFQGKTKARLQVLYGGIKVLVVEDSCLTLFFFAFRPSAYKLHPRHARAARPGDSGDTLGMMLKVCNVVWSR